MRSTTDGFSSFSNNARHNGKTATKQRQTFIQVTPLATMSLHAVMAINAPIVRFALHLRRLSLSSSVKSNFASNEISILFNMAMNRQNVDFATIPKRQNSDMFFDPSHRCDLLIPIVQISQQVNQSKQTSNRFALLTSC